jgi:hypothetical protein
MKNLKTISIFLAITTLFVSLFTFTANAQDIVADSIGDEVATWVNISESVKKAATLGDVNGDGQLNVLDITLIRRYIAGGYDVTVDSDVADINKDGNINVLDITLIRRHIAGGYPDADEYWKVKVEDENDGWTEGIYRP